MPFLKSIGLNKPQRMIAAIYFLSLAYCCVWVPWSVDHQRLGYGWVWAGPRYPHLPPQTSADHISGETGTAFVPIPPHEWILPKRIVAESDRGGVSCIRG
jgi:hypothetical protein